MPGEPYYLGFFLMGAYQDIMGASALGFLSPWVVGGRRATPMLILARNGLGSASHSKGRAGRFNNCSDGT